MTAAVYVARNDSGEVLYVGCTTQFERRMSSHRSTSAWHSDATRIDVERFDSVGAAREAEKSLIQQWSPPFNVQHTGRHTKRPTNMNQELAFHMLGQPLAKYVADWRHMGASWSQIAVTLEADTGGVVAVSRESLRQWYGDVAA